jgi:GTPase SAR1 family protein
MFDINDAYSEDNVPTSDFLFKVILIGDSGVGKSTIMRRWMNGTIVCLVFFLLLLLKLISHSIDDFAFTSTTIGSECHVKTFPLNGQNITFQFWDTGKMKAICDISFFSFFGSYSLVSWAREISIADC